MDIIGNRRFIELPGSKLHELPPLMVRTNYQLKRLDKMVGMAKEIAQTENLLDETAFFNATDIEKDRRTMDLAINLVEQYISFLTVWRWGDSMLEWIRQCETTFQYTHELQNVLRPDIWPHASRSSFVTLLHDKAVKPDGVDLEKAIGMRLTFRQPPPISCFSNQFLFYLNNSVAGAAYKTWSHLAPDPVSSFPPERFTFDVVRM
jgi:hypothetical protein